MTNFGEATPISRRDRSCYWCPELIRKGERYTRDTGVYDGDFFSSAWHPECLAACKDGLPIGGGEYCPEGRHERGGKCNEEDR